MTKTSEMVHPERFEYWWPSNYWGLQENHAQKVIPATLETKLLAYKLYPWLPSPLGICRKCGDEYNGRPISRRCDYGYCSMECMIADKPSCPQCGDPVLPNPNKTIRCYADKVFCTPTCGARFYGLQGYTEESLAKYRMSSKKFWASPEGETQKQRLSKKYSGVSRMEHSEAISKGVRAFWDSPEGDKRRLEIRQEQKRYWETPEGQERLKRLIEERTGELNEAPRGPNWHDARKAAKKRDSYLCQICGIDDEQSIALYDYTLDVHHIYSRRQYGYIPGENMYYLWANHLANLVTLCARCHGRVENNVIQVPRKFQEQADWLWYMFEQDDVQLPLIP